MKEERIGIILNGSPLFTGGAGMIYKTTWYGLLYFFLTGAVSYFLGSQLTAVQWRRSWVI